MFLEILLAASSASANYDELRTKALAEENYFSQEQRSSWYPLKLRLFNEAVPQCLNGPMKRHSVEFNAVAVIQDGHIKDVVLAKESRDTKCLARQLRGAMFPPVEKLPELVSFEFTWTPA